MIHPRANLTLPVVPDRWVNEQTRSTLHCQGGPLAEAVQVVGGWVGRSTLTGALCSPCTRPDRAGAITDIFERKQDLLEERYAPAP